MNLRLVLSTNDRIALMILLGLVLVACLSFIAGRSRPTRLFGLCAFLLIGFVSILSFYAHR